MVSPSATFAAPLLLFGLATAYCVRSTGEAADGRRAVWAVLAVASSFVAAASALAAFGAQARAVDVAFFAGSALMFAGTLALASVTLPGAKPARPYDVVAFAALLLLVAVPGVILPDLARGAWVVAAGFGLDLLALVTALTSTTVLRPRHHHNVSWALAASCLAIAGAGALLALGAAGTIGGVPIAEAAVLAIAAYMLAAAAALELTPVREDAIAVDDADGAIRVIRTPEPQPSRVSGHRVRGNPAPAPAARVAARSRG